MNPRPGPPTVTPRGRGLGSHVLRTGVRLDVYRRPGERQDRSPRTFLVAVNGGIGPIHPCFPLFVTPTGFKLRPRGLPSCRRGRRGGGCDV